LQLPLVQHLPGVPPGSGRSRVCQIRFQGGQIALPAPGITQVNRQGTKAQDVIPTGTLFARVENFKGKIIGRVHANSLGKIGLAGRYQGQQSASFCEAEIDG
jgi:hypothetical protein